MALTKIPSELSSTTGIVDNSNATAITIDSNENVGIGITNPSDYYAENLVVGAADEGGITIECGTSEKAYLMFADGTSGSQAYRGYLGYDHNLDSFNVVSLGYMNFYSGDGGANAERMRIDSSGNLLVGDTSVIRASSQDGVSVEPQGRIYMSRGTGTGGYSHLAFINGNGTVGSVVTSGSSTSYNTTSDYRLKENVVELTGATERLKQLNPSRFNFIADADTTVDGFLAHEVADVVPEAISGEKDAVDADGNPEYQGIDQSKLVPLLVATIQELEARITELENN